MLAVHVFQHPRLAVKLSLGHKYNGWYLIFAQPCPTADTRQVARLDTPAPRRRRSRPSGWSRRSRFWFDPRAVTGWEAPGESLLDFLLALDVRTPPLFAVVDQELGPGGGGTEVEVEVLIPESKLAHFCESCGRWEIACDDSLRWFMVREAAHPGALPGYLCPSCHAKDWFGPRALRYLRRILCFGIS